ncbi:hypothetical protein NDU88_007691 [Pleurodeles waltl]|uniref:Uncharacterized protein n=1 Tax=Pleurodeles waltl TaxID=8319 RepID=A0AAV7U185_PLEWA|nr:hypothetical protein NDU88_007691 [Pleurodeles waltl]
MRRRKGPRALPCWEPGPDSQPEVRRGCDGAQEEPSPGEVWSGQEARQRAGVGALVDAEAQRAAGSSVLGAGPDGQSEERRGCDGAPEEPCPGARRSGQEAR